MLIHNGMGAIVSILTLLKLMNQCSGPALLKCGRKEKRQWYNQLQLLTSQYNSSLSHLLPFSVYGANAAAVVAAAFLLRPNPDIVRTLPGLYPLMLEIVLSNIFMEFPLMRYIERMKMESEAVVKDVEYVIVRRTVWAWKNDELVPRVHNRLKRLYRLRPLRIKFGEIRYIDEGMMINIAMAHLDDVVNMVLMVDIRNDSWLLKLPR